MFHRKKVNNILRKARRIDKKYEIFGVSRHHYKLNCPVNKEFVHKVEEKYHFILPKDYAQFITEVGDGGARVWNISLRKNFNKRKNSQNTKTL